MAILIVKSYLEKFICHRPTKYCEYTDYIRQVYYRGYQIPVFEYVYSRYQAIRAVLFKQDLTLSGFLEEEIFGKKKTLATGRIIINNKFLNIRNIICDYTSEDPRYNVFLDRLHKRLLEYGLLAIETSIKVGKLSHSNMLLFYRNPDTDRVTVIRYEPNGVFSPHKVIDNTLTNFLTILKERYTDRYGILEEVTGSSVSCPVGPQGLSLTGKVGYCVMFSLLWLYVLMILIKEDMVQGEYDDIEELTKSIDNIILESTMDEDLNIIILNFANYVCDTVDKYISEEQRESFEKEVESAFRRTLADPRILGSPLVTDKGGVGQPCKIDDHCTTGKCVKNICI